MCYFFRGYDEIETELCNLGALSVADIRVGCGIRSLIRVIETVNF